MRSALGASAVLGTVLRKEMHVKVGHSQVFVPHVFTTTLPWRALEAVRLAFSTNGQVELHVVSVHACDGKYSEEQQYGS